MRTSLETYEEIGMMAERWYFAEKDRIIKRLARAKARSEHPCETGNDEEGPCYYQYTAGSFGTPVLIDEWCENCQYCQPFHLEYRAAADKAMRLRQQLTRKIQRKVVREAPHE